MERLKISCCWWWRTEKVLVFLFVLQVSYCIRNEQREEPDYHKVSEHPDIDENSAIDETPFVPHKVSTPSVPAVVANCKCGEHDYNGTRLDFANGECGERPFTFAANGLREVTPGKNPVRLGIGGSFTDPSQFPWVVALVERKSNGSAIHFCGGTLISNKLVLTATHCFTRIMIKDTEVWLNEKNLLLSTDDKHHTIKIQAKRLIIHPMYNPIMNYNDISLVELTEAVDITESFLRPICLPTDGTFDQREYAFTAGWGQISVSGPKSDHLKHVCLPLLLPEVCKANADPFFTKRVTDYMICAGDTKKGGRDTCPGDSGGPLFVEAGTGENRHYLVGIVSWGMKCGQPKRPGVYTRVSKYIRWIYTESVKIPGNTMCS